MAGWTKNRMKSLGKLDILGEFDVTSIIEFDKEQYKQEVEKDKKLPKEYAKGRPIYISGRDLIKFRK